MEDVTPQLVENVTGEFRRLYAASGKISGLLQKVKAKTVTYAEAQEYALEVSRLIGQAWEKHVTPDTLPDGRMYYNIASRLIPAALDENHALVAGYAAEVQKELNDRAGIGLKAQKAELDGDRVKGLVDLASNAERYDEVSGKLLSSFENFSQHIVDETIRKNADFHHRSGLSPKIVRRSNGKCCAWCRALAGTHDYPTFDRDVYRRHDNCRCTVLYDPADGSKKFQNVHSRRWTNEQDYDKLNLRKKFGLMTSDKRHYESDILVPLGVGAKQKDVRVRLPTGEKVILTPGSRITHVQTIAGLGRQRQIDMVDLLVERYPGTDATKWQKKKGIGYVDYDGESYKCELHWYEEPSAGRVEFKIKPDADGNWFYDDE